MRLLSCVPVWAFLTAQAAADSTVLVGTNTITSSIDLDAIPTAASLYKSYGSTITESSGSGTTTANITGSISANHTGSVHTTTSDPYTLLVGGGGTTTLSANATTLAGNATRASTSSGTVVPTNTRPCNGYPEFCARNYTNITFVAAHNSPFDRSGNWASNQELDVTTQLNDGVRMLQFQTHYQNQTILLCHSSCEILNMGPLESYMANVTKWIRQNPYDVVTILMGNSDFIDPNNYTDPITASGLIDYVYTPPKIPMALDDWPTMSELILTGKRAIVFMDYQANQTAIPWLLDEFSQMWETPFSPTDRNFPCTVQRPPGLSDQDAGNRMYMANHNLNTEVTALGASLLVPNTVLLNVTNAVSGYGSVGWAAQNCTTMWNRPPNFLLVDYYNIGNVNGSVFEVAAQMNNVTYNGRCCGSKSSAAPWSFDQRTSVYLLVAAAALMNMI